MNTKPANTDRRLLAILSGGDVLLNRIDPEGILSKGRTLKYGYERRDDSWKAIVIFRDGDALSLKGTFNDIRETIRSIRLSENPERWDRIPVEAAETACTALGDVSSIPARLKRNLVPAGKRTPNTEGFQEPGPRKYFELLCDALFWDVEGAEGAGTIQGFESITATYVKDKDGNTIKVQIKALKPVPEGRITVSGDADVFGLGNKKVTLEKNIGLGSNVTIDCRTNRKGREVPSLKVAEDVAGNLPVLYTGERKEAIVNSSENNRKENLFEYHDRFEQLAETLPFLGEQRESTGFLNWYLELEEMVHAIYGTRCFIVWPQGGRLNAENTAFLQMPAQSDEQCREIIDAWVKAVSKDGQHDSRPTIRVIEIEPRLFLEISACADASGNQKLHYSILVKDGNRILGKGFAPFLAYDKKTGTLKRYNPSRQSETESLRKRYSETVKRIGTTLKEKPPQTVRTKR